MSMALILGTKPHGLEVKTHGFGGLDNIVLLGEYEISLEDFLVAAHYVLTNTDLSSDDDPRLQFVKSVQGMREVDGYNAPAKRLHTDELPIPSEAA